MTGTDIKTVAVIGAGTMGRSIAQVCAAAGFNVLLSDANTSALNNAVDAIKKSLEMSVSKGKATDQQVKSILGAITIQPDITQTKADLVIEAIVEDLVAKQELFGKLEDTNYPSTIFATNTSSVSITQIASKLTRPERLAGLHFFNPATLMKLVEVVKGSQTSQSTIDVLISFSRQLRKQPVLAQDSPGFIVNRVARQFYVESLKLLEENVASHKQIDELIRSSGFKMGPFELMDLIGIDVNFAVTSSLYNGFHQDPKFRPSRIQQQKVETGHLGRKTGKGFYDYGGQSKN